MRGADGVRGRAGGAGRPREHAVWTRAALDTGRPLDLLTARFEEHRYAPHSHPEYTVGVCVGGSEAIAYRGGTIYPGVGSIVVLGPGEPHTGAPASPQGYAYLALYPGAELLSDATLGAPHFGEPVVDDPRLADALVRAHTALRRGVEPLEAESRLPWLLSALARRHGGARPVRDTVPGAAAITRAVRDRLAGELLAPPSLAQLAAEHGLSRYQLLRAFRDSMGMPPYAWLAQYRVGRARALLEAGYRPARVAGLVGFADQAHLTRWFRRVLGVTPAAYRAEVLGGRNRTPDGDADAAGGRG
ncbi:helix-turn-helix domain-containing protein [Streptomyces sp. NPDC050560]|uniref:helix-turn-helix domain-containing protein n=1 Tax=Streptomyces sp. NPDC050560 TaxID=3365630 RepID=UPI00379FC745